MTGLSVLAAAASDGEAVAVVTSGEVLTFGDLAPRVRATMGWLGRRPNPSAPVAVVATLRVETLLLFYAAIELGLPLFPIHPRLTPSERAAIVELGAAAPIEESWTVPGEGDAAVALPSLPIDAEAPLAVLFTSGSSGTPKGVVLSRRAFVEAATASGRNLGWTAADRWLLCMPLAHVGGLSVITRCLLARRPVVLAPWTGDVAALRADVDRSRVTILSLVPTMLRRILDQVPDGPVFGPQVRIAMVGGDAASTALLDEATQRGIPIVTTYGMTETCSQIATARPGERSAGVGAPLPGVLVRVVDGELHVRTPTAMSEYFPSGRWPSPFDADGWLRTGDLGSVDASGIVHVHGRRSDMIITGGENVDPAEVEAVVRGCAAVVEARAFGVADERWGQIVAVAVVITGEPDTALDAIRDAVEERLAAHKRPRKVAICASLPVAATGKLDRRGLAASLSGSLIPLAR